MIGVRAHKMFAGHHHCGEAGLHVRGPATNEVSNCFGGDEGVGLPLAHVSGRNHVSVSGKDQQRPRRTACRPEIIDLTKAQGLDCKPYLLQTRHHQRLAPRVLRGD